MKAIIYREYGGPEVLQLAELSRPSPAAGQVLIRVEATSVNSADVRFMRANPFLVRLMNGLVRPKKRRVLGQDVAGVVVEVGEGVTRVAPGDRVFGETPMASDGAFAEYCVAEERSVARLPEKLGVEQAAALPLAGTTALQALRAAGARPGMRLLVAGAGGGVGVFAVQLAKLLGAHVTASCGPKSCARVKSLGADVVLDYTRSALSGEFDAVIAVNGYQPLATYRRLLVRGGVYVMVGGTSRQLFSALLFAKPYFAVHGRRAVTLSIDVARQAEDVEQLGAWAAGGKLRVLVEKSYALERVADAMAHAERGHVAGKIIVSPLSPCGERDRVRGNPG